MITLSIRYKSTSKGEWEDVETFHPRGLSVVRIGRLASINDLVLSDRQSDRSYISKRHCTLLLQPDQLDYEIMDGTISEIGVGERGRIIPSTCGTLVNNRKLDLGEKRLLKNKDIIAIVPNQIEISYLHPELRVWGEEFDTYVPTDEEDL